MRPRSRNLRSYQLTFRRSHQLTIMALGVWVAVCGVAACSGEESQAATRVEPPPAAVPVEEQDEVEAEQLVGELVDLELDVSGMTCTGCAYNVQSALSHVAGVQEAMVDFPTRRATVRFDEGRCGPEELIEAVAALGQYNAERLPEDGGDAPLDEGMQPSEDS